MTVRSFLLIIIIFCFANVNAQLTVFFSQERGYYEDSVYLELSSTNANASIYYTTDNSVPSLDNGYLYSGPLTLHSTTVVRAFAYVDPVCSAIKTHSFIIFNDLFTLDHLYYHIISDPYYFDLLDEAFLDLPTLSIVAEGEIIEDEKKEVSLEFIFPDSNNDFSIGCGAKRYGGISVYLGKSSIRLYFKEKYGAKKLNFPIFEGYENGIEAVEEFDQIELRSGAQNSFASEDWSNVYVGPMFADYTMLEMGEINSHGRFVHLFVNKEYVGIYHLRERINQDFMSTYLGGEDSDYESVDDAGPNLTGNWASDEPFEGSGEIWDELVSKAGDYHAWKELINQNSFFDFMLMFMWGQHENEYKASGSRIDGKKYIFRVNDADGIFNIQNGLSGDVYHDRTDPFAFGGNNCMGPDSMFLKLYDEADPDFFMAFADRAFCHCYGDGPLTKQSSIDRIDRLSSEIELAIIAESARWGSELNSPGSWHQQINNAKEIYIENRTDTLKGQLKARGLLPLLDGIELQGGVQDSNFELVLVNPNNSGDVYYTVNGEDVRLQGGNINPNASLYTSPVTLPDGFTTVNVRVYDPDNSDPLNSWSPSCAKRYIVGQEYGDLIINEVYANPKQCYELLEQETQLVNGSKFEFIELYNRSNKSIFLNELKFVKGIEFEFSNGSQIKPNSYFILANNNYYFKQRFGFDPDGIYNGTLNNSADTIVLNDPMGNPIFKYNYKCNLEEDLNDRYQYYSVALNDPELDFLDLSNWEYQSLFCSPGQENNFTNMNTTEDIDDNELCNGYKTNLNKIELFPNPVVQTLFINFLLKDELDHIIVYDLNANIMSKFNLNNYSTNALHEFKIDFKQYETGFYFVKLNYKNNSSEIYKVLKGYE